MAQNSAMMLTGDILSLGHRGVWHLPSPKGETQERQAPRCQSRQKGTWLCARSQRTVPLDSFSPGLPLLVGPACFVFAGGLWLPRKAPAPTAQGRSPAWGTKEEQPGSSQPPPQASEHTIRGGHCSGDCPCHWPFWGRPVSPGLPGCALSVLLEAGASTVQPGLGSTGYSVPYGVGAVPRTQARRAQVDIHSTLTWSAPPAADIGIQHEEQSGHPKISWLPWEGVCQALCGLQVLGKCSALEAQMLPWWACFRSPV